MPMIDPVPNTWTATTALAANEGWQCREGSVLVTADSSPGDDHGIQLSEGQAWTFPPGTVVQYRAISENAKIQREVVA